ncbi:hypothetical protein O9992_11265 [Vibrio lentus]|nr:hypothetical protein [Vibrio lentus]
MVRRLVFFDDEYKAFEYFFWSDFYIDKDTKQTLDNDDSTTRKLIIRLEAIEMDFNYDDYLFYHGGVQYDIDTCDATCKQHIRISLRRRLHTNQLPLCNRRVHK